MKRMILAALVLVPLIGVGYWAIACPCGGTPGLYLRGTEVTEPVTNWSFANQVPLCQVQVDAGLLPHALNLNCWADSQGNLYLGCAACEGKRWSAAAVANDRARVRLATNVYPVTLTRVVGGAELDRVWASRVTKFGNRGNAARQADWWTFHAVSR
jgi:hypothetical protein